MKTHSSTFRLAISSSRQRLSCSADKQVGARAVGMRADGRSAAKLGASGRSLAGNEDVCGTLAQAEQAEQAQQP